MRVTRQALMALVVSSLLVASFGGVATAQLEEPPESAPTEVRAERAETAEERRQQRATERQEAVDALQAERVSTRCAAAQSKIQDAITKSNEIEANRTDAYANISTKLTAIIARLDAAEIDSTEVSGQQEEFSEKVRVFGATFDQYQLALEDAALIDCVADTEGFILALEEARTLRTDLKTQAGELRTYVADTIIATLNEIKDSISSQDSTDEEGQE